MEVDIVTEWNLKVVSDNTIRMTQAVDIVTEWNLKVCEEKIYVND